MLVVDILESNWSMRVWSSGRTRMVANEREHVGTIYDFFNLELFMVELCGQKPYSKKTKACRTKDIRYRREEIARWRREHVGIFNNVFRSYFRAVCSHRDPCGPL